MYKLILGSVRVTVEDDAMSREEAAALARREIAFAQGQGRLLSHIEISGDKDSAKTRVTERPGGKTGRKTLRQSLIDGTVAAAREKFYPVSSFAARDSWFDSDTGQEWFGSTVAEAREEVLKELEKWAESTR